MAQAYLLAFLFWSGIPLGSLAVLMVQDISGGAWGAVIRRTLEAATRTLPLLLLLFLPIVLQTASLYEWAHAEAVAPHTLVNAVPVSWLAQPPRQVRARRKRQPGRRSG